MPRKPVWQEKNNYLVIWQEGFKPHWQEYVGARNAITGYRQLRRIHGNECRLVKVVLDYGEEVV